MAVDCVPTRIESRAANTELKAQHVLLFFQTEEEEAPEKRHFFRTLTRVEEKWCYDELPFVVEMT